MKKLLFTLIMFFFFTGNSFATDACDEFRPELVEFVGEVTITANIRSFPCTTKSSILGSTQIGDSFNVTAKVDGYYQILLTDGRYGWVWDQAMKISEKILEKKYYLTDADRILSQKVAKKVEKIVELKGMKYRDIIIAKLERIQRKKKEGSKIYELLKQIVIDTKKINYKNIYIKHYKEFHIDIEKVKNTWISWHNDIRKNMKLPLQSNDQRLDNTAFEWAYISDKKESMDHKRNSSDGFYNYKVIEAWFQERGVHCKIKDSTTTSESIGTYGYKCSDGECTDELLDSMKAIFDIYMAEKNLPFSQNQHYRAIVHDDISKLGLGIYLSDAPIDENGWGGENYYNYYLVTHYCTEFKN